MLIGQIKKLMVLNKILKGQNLFNWAIQRLRINLNKLNNVLHKYWLKFKADVGTLVTILLATLDLAVFLIDCVKWCYITLRITKVE